MFPIRVFKADIKHVNEMEWKVFYIKMKLDRESIWHTKATIRDCSRVGIITGLHGITMLIEGKGDAKIDRTFDPWPC